MLVFFILCFVSNVALALRQCGNTTTFCPASGQCCHAQYSNTGYGCRLAGSPSNAEIAWPPSPTASCCMPGPELPPSSALPNCLVVGDSVSIGYTGTAAVYLKEVCALQHGPWDTRDGGAGSTAVGVACLDNFLVTQAQQPVKWDVILFNFGLHDLNNSAVAEAIYRRQLLNITRRLQLTGAKLIYATTTPYMPDTTKGNFVVDQLNAIALEMMHSVGNVTILDLHKLVTDHCGIVYSDCDWCRRHPCSYHYNSVGEAAQARAVAEAFRSLL